MIFGTPTGSARIPAVAIDVPPDPPADNTPPIPRCVSIQRANASAIALTDAPRSWDITAESPRGCMIATWFAGMSARAGLPEVDRSTVRTGNPSAFSRSAMKRSSRPFVSKVPATSTVRPIRSAKGMANTEAAAASAFGATGRRRSETGRFQRFGRLVTGA